MDNQLEIRMETVVVEKCYEDAISYNGVWQHFSFTCSILLGT